MAYFFVIILILSIEFKAKIINLCSLYARLSPMVNAYLYCEEIEKQRTVKFGTHSKEKAILFQPKNMILFAASSDIKNSPNI